eukprot:18566-Heterococcus_DN1.PRE.3
MHSVHVSESADNMNKTLCSAACVHSLKLHRCLRLEAIVLVTTVVSAGQCSCASESLATMEYLHR